MIKKDNFSRVASRFVKELYAKDELGNFKFSSTFTLVKYSFNNSGVYHEFIIFAYHATHECNGELAKEEPLNNLYFLAKDDEFIPLKEKIKNFIVSIENDIVICELSIRSKSTNYFNLNFYEIGFSHPILNKKNKIVSFYVENRRSFMNKSTLCWIGFPARRNLDFHKTKSSPNKIKEQYITKVDEYGELKVGLGKYLLIANISNYRDINFNQISNFSDNENVIIGNFTNKNVVYFPSNETKSKGYSLKGMSGGALFLQSNFFQDLIIQMDLNQIQENYELLYNFIGIGLEFSEKEERIKGVSAAKIIDILKINKDKFLK